MYQNAKGVNKYGNLDIEIEINGEVPTFPADIDLEIRVRLAPVNQIACA